MYWAAATHMVRHAADIGGIAPRPTCSRRVELGWTQAALAERSGVSQADISRLENGRLDARWSTIHRLSAALESATEPPRRSLANGYRVTKPPSAPSTTWSAKGPIGKISRADS